MTITCTISPKLKEGDKFEVAFHEMRVNRISDRREHYNVAEVEVLSAIRHALGKDLATPPLKIFGKVLEGTGCAG